MTLHNEDLTAARHAVEHLFGKCVLTFQAYENLLKAIISEHRLSAHMADIEDIRADRAAKTRQKTMGALMSEMIGSFIVPEGKERQCEDREDAPSVAFNFQLSFTAEEFARVEAEHRELVVLRNSLVHHFLEQHNLRSVDGCLVAQQTLTSALDRVARAHKELQCWANDMVTARKVLADYMLSPELDDFFVHGRVPWHIVTITHALREAAMELARGDWAPVDTAISWIEERYPEEQPKDYGCKTWRQVIHESKHFDLQVRKVDGRRRAWYRPRNRSAASG
ncbi:OST-HTH/LOTUS domain-containing protein [Roseovarius mucosus]|uniref:OST-HTH/LOTUS domain-containing protein n=1 Tax=Roseovarius mucosus TaxID=215743 RepID=UPI001C5E7C9F|nr:OST-HTH/LOTUS domain-containing protein [Roseovarius mucosus]MBW4974063.1 OST-HTH/LOTUS domain-containing protein [Roseovarius mucosus]